ncbi:hypothetical protein D9M69_682100 [compost metagenome]
MRAGAARIDVEHATALLDLRLVGVAGDHHANPGGSGGELRQVVYRMHEHAASVQQGRFRNAGGPRLAVVVAPHHGQRRDGGERIEDAGIADVPAMHDEIAALQRRHGLWSQQAVGVGDEADADQAASSCLSTNGRMPPCL